MSKKILNISEDFWNIRGDFKIGGVLNIGTHASLVKLNSGKFVLLDAYTLEGEVKDEVMRLTQNGGDLEAIINLHPFHTLHVKGAHDLFPNAKLYGTQRHIDKFPELAWQPELTESLSFAALYSEDFEFSVPAGVDFISRNENLHFSSVLAYHKASKTIHSDDTLMYLPLPWPISKVKKPEISFHITLPKTLERKAGAASEFRQWARNLANKWKGAENLCAAHSFSLLKDKNTGASIHDRILNALDKVESTLQKHETKFG